MAENASKNGQNTTFFTPGDQDVKLWNKSQIFEILKHFLTENEKNWGHAPQAYQQDATFTLCEFILFKSENYPNWPKCVQKWSKYNFFTPGGQNMKLWNKSQFFEILKHFLTENEKTEAMLLKRIEKTQLLPFVWFFPLQSENPPKRPKCVQKWSKYNFFTPGGQNM